MAARIIDLDGTMLFHGSNRLLPGALDLLKAIHDNGDQIIFVTRRGDKEFAGNKFYSQKAAQEAVDSFGVPYHAIVFDVLSPRTVINDDGAFAHDHKCDMGWGGDEIEQVLALGHSR